MNTIEAKTINACLKRHETLTVASQCYERNNKKCNLQNRYLIA